MMFWYGGGWPFWQVALMGVIMVAFWGLVIWAVYALVTGAGGRPGGEDRSADARRILDARVARGEIDTVEYRRLRGLIAAEGDRQAADLRSGR